MLFGAVAPQTWCFQALQQIACEKCGLILRKQEGTQRETLIGHIGYGAERQGERYTAERCNEGNLLACHSREGGNPGLRKMALPIFRLAREWLASSTPWLLSQDR